MAELFRTGRICAVVAERDAAAMARALRRALRVSKTVELRLDWLRSAGEIERMIRWLAANRKRLGTASRVTLIATCRRRGAGGEFVGGVREELELLRGAAAAGCRWVDLEIESAEWMRPEEVQELRRVARVLISYHNFRRTLPNLRNVRIRMENARGDAIKIAAEARGLRDALRILKRRGGAGGWWRCRWAILPRRRGFWLCGGDQRWLMRRWCGYCAGADFVRGDDIALSRGSIDAADAHLCGDWRSDRTFALAAVAECWISDAGDGRGLCAGVGARFAGFFGGDWAAGDCGIQRDFAAQGSDFAVSR